VKEMKVKQKYPINEQKDVSVKEEASISTNLLTIDELSEWLGVEKSTIYAWTSKKIIPHIKLSKKMLRFRFNEILDWLAENSVSPESRDVKQVKRKCKSSRKSSASDDYVDRLIKEAIRDVSRH
jgi:excisionase family DNA binding protein